MYQYLTTTIQNVDKLVESLVDNIVNDHNEETNKVLSRFGYTLTYKQEHIYKAERNMELRDKIKTLIFSTLGQFTSNYSIDNKSWCESYLGTTIRYYKITILNPNNYPIKQIKLAEVVDNE